MTDDRDIAQWDAAYVLGALSPRDRHEYEDYLAANPESAGALSEFAGLPSILNALSPEEALALLDPTPASADEQPVSSISSLAAAAQRRQRRSRRNTFAAMAATAAAFLAVGVIVTAGVLGRSSSSSAPALQAMAPAGRGGITAELAVTEKQWGTRLDWSCEYDKDWSRKVGSYDLVVTTADGAQTVVGSWRPAGDEAAGLAAATVIPTSQIRSVAIRVTGTDAPLATRTL